MNLKLACSLGLALSMVLMPIAQAGAESKNLDKVFVPTRAPRDDHMQWGIEFDEPFERVNRRLASKKIVPYPDAAIAPQAYKDGKRPWLMVNTASGKPLLVCDKTAKG